MVFIVEPTLPSFGGMTATTSRSVMKLLQSTCKMAALFGLSLVWDGLLPDDRVGSLPHRGLAGPQGVLRHLLAACIVQSPNTVDACSLQASSKALKARITNLLAACITQCKACGQHLATEPACKDCWLFCCVHLSAL